jgi:hypothetical protein
MDCVVNLKSGLEEIYRILRPGGKFVFSIRHPTRNLEYMGSEASYFGESWYWEQWEGTGGRRVLRRYMSQERWTQLVSDIGFEFPPGYHVPHTPQPDSSVLEIAPEIYERYARRPGALIYSLRKL